MNLPQAVFQPNFCEIILEARSFSIFFAPYSEELFQQCKDFFGEFYFHRDGPFIYSWHIECSRYDHPLEAFSPVVVTLNDNLFVVSKIVEIAIKYYFSSFGRKVKKDKYSSTHYFQIQLKSEQSFDLGLLKLLPVLNYRVLPLSKGLENFILLTLSKEYKPSFEGVTANDFENAGIDTRDFIEFDGYYPANSRNKYKYLERSSQTEKYKHHSGRLRNHENEYQYITKVFEQLNKDAGKFVLPTSDSQQGIQKFSYLSIPSARFSIGYAPKPNQYFYNDRLGSGLYDVSLKTHKPYSYEIYKDRQVKVAVFIPKAHAKSCEEFTKKIASSLREIFHLNQSRFTTFYMGENRNEHLNSISQFNNNEYDVAIIYLNKIDKEQSKKLSAYNILKAKLLTKHIPSQIILVESTQFLSNDLFAIKNICLNIYSKIGGTPWTIGNDIRSAEEFIIGIGSSLNEDLDRTIGFANVFDYNGSYLIGDCSQISDMAGYKQSLQYYLVQLLSELVSIKAIPENTRIRLIFHLFKDASKKYEIAAIENAISEFPNYNIEFAIVHISLNHNLKCFVSDGRNQAQRGAYIELGNHLALLFMGGKNTSPLLVRVDSRSTFDDLFELSKQILFFSHLPQRSLKPANTPVTVNYPKLVAKVTNDLLLVNRWDPDTLHGMKDKLWFV